MFGRTGSAVMMTSPYCVSATDYARDLYAGATFDATLRQHSGLALRHGPVHGAGAIYRQTPYSDVKFERGGDVPVYEVGPAGTAAAGMCWTGHDMYAPSSATMRTNHRVGHSFPSVPLDGSNANATPWHTFSSYVQPYGPCEMTVAGLEARTSGSAADQVGVRDESGSRQCVNCGEPLNSLSRLDFSTGHYLCGWCYGNNNNSVDHAMMMSRHEITGYGGRNISRKPVGGSRRSGLRCVNCGCTASTLWRRNNEGDTVCNACGLYYKLHGINRPPTMRKDGIQTRKRRPKVPKGLSCNGTSDVMKTTPSSPHLQQQQRHQLQTSDTKFPDDRSPSDSQSDTCRRATVADDVRDCSDLSMVATPYGGWATTENSSPDKINFRPMTTSSAETLLPLCMMNGSSSKRHLASNAVINDRTDTSAKSKCFGTDLSQYNGKVPDSYNPCHVQSRSAIGTIGCEVPWYGVGSLPASAIPVMTSQERHSNYVTDDVSIYEHVNSRRYCGEEMSLERRRCAY